MNAEMLYINDVPVIQTRLNTEFTYDIMNPYSLVSVTGLHLNRMHIAILACMHFVKTRYQDMDVAKRYLYFPLLLLSECGLRIPCLIDDLFQIPADCLIKLNDKMFIYMSRSGRKSWHEISLSLAENIKEIQDQFAERNKTFLLEYTDDLIPNASKRKGDKEYFIAIIISWCLSSFQNDPDMKWIKDTYGIEDFLFMDPEAGMPEDELRMESFCFWQMSTENLMLANLGKDGNDDEIKKYIFS